MTGKGISQIKLRKAGSDEFYFVFRLPSDGMFVSIFFDCIAEAVAEIETSQRNSQEDSYYAC